MRKFVAAVVVAIPLLFAGVAVADHVSQTEEHVVPYTIGDVTGALTIQDEDPMPHPVTITETVTVTVTEPPPPPSAACNDGLDNDGDGLIDYPADPGCVSPTDTGEFNAPPPSGTTINVTDRWLCDRPLSEYGPLPIRIVSTIQNATFNGNTAVGLNSGCVGDGTPAIDLIVNINGNGGSIGPGQDALRFSGTAHDIQLSGYAECGAVAPGAHQDVMQAGGGQRITAVGLTSGNVNTGEFTCRGAGGGWFITNFNGNDPTDIVCDGCRMVTSNTGMRIGPSLRSGARNSTFMAQTPYDLDGGQSPVNTGNTFISTG